MKDFVPYLFVCILADMVLFGAETSKFDTPYFGEAKHGDFTANLDALGYVPMIGIFEKSTTWFKRFVAFVRCRACCFYDHGTCLAKWIAVSFADGE